MQRAGDRPLLDEVIVHRAREQFPHPVSSGVLPVVRGRGRLAAAQQQVVVARLVHLAPSCAPAIRLWSAITLVAHRVRAGTTS
jgi:hypothetical protein